jgi:hypothetical protein
MAVRWREHDIVIGCRALLDHFVRSLPLHLRASHLRHVSANAVVASFNLPANPCDSRRGATTAPVIVHIQGRSCGALLLWKIRPIARSRSSTSKSSGLAQRGTGSGTIR